jgi:hypothetical protein
MFENVKASTSHNPKGLHNLYKDNFTLPIGEIGCDGVDWIDVAQDRDQWRALVSTVMNLRVP